MALFHSSRIMGSSSALEIISPAHVHLQNLIISGEDGALHINCEIQDSELMVPFYCYMGSCANIFIICVL